jgi:DNA-binding transcriptional MerR regulator
MVTTQYTPKMVEERFGIVQQIRDRIDKQYSAFISPKSGMTRTYHDSDILVYEVILEAKKQGLKRPDIIAKLVKLAQDGIINQYEPIELEAKQSVVRKVELNIPRCRNCNEAISTETYNAQYGYCTDCKVKIDPDKSFNDFQRIEKPQPKERKPQQSHNYDIAEKIGILQEQVNVLREENGDLAYAVSSLEKSVEEMREVINVLMTRIDQLEAKPNGFISRILG